MITEEEQAVLLAAVREFAGLVERGAVLMTPEQLHQRDQAVADAVSALVAKQIETGINRSYKHPAAPKDPA